MTHPQLTPAYVQRLALVRYAYDIAEVQSRQKEPQSTLSLLMFHDAVELFLQLASEAHNVGKSGAEFMKYWEVLDSALAPHTLPRKEPMRRLDKARGNLKHQGILIPQSEVEGFRAAVTNFLDEATPIVFGVEFGAISMVDLIRNDDCRNRLKRALALREEGNVTAAATQAAIAMQIALGEYRNKSAFGGPGMRSFSSEIERRFRRVRDVAGSFELATELGRLSEAILDTLAALYSGILVQSAGIDFHGFFKFLSTVPKLDQTANGTYHANFFGINYPTSESLAWCIAFAVRAIIQLETTRMDTPPPAPPATGGGCYITNVD